MPIYSRTDYHLVQALKQQETQTRAGAANRRHSPADHK
jgi:hypothetical protein